MNPCLMIRTKDRRKFFTPSNNYDHLVEFSKVFNAEVSLVNVHEGEILDLDNLVPAICNASYKPASRPKYEIVEIKIPQIARKLQKRHTILKVAAQIKKYITETFLACDVVSLREIQQRFHAQHLSVSCLCNHIARVKRELGKKGKRFIKVGAGKYAIKS